METPHLPYPAPENDAQSSALESAGDRPVAHTLRRPSALTHFLILPALIVVGGMVSVLLFGLITKVKESPYEFLDRIRSGNSRTAEQAATELAQYIARNREALSGDERFIGEVLTEFRAPITRSASIRPYLALVLGKLGNPRAESALIEALQELDAVLKVYCTVALGELKSKAAVPALIEGLKSADIGLRLSSAGALGEIGARQAVEPLTAALQDAEDEVRWNVAVALAKLGDSAGKKTLVQMLSLEHYIELRERNPRYRNMREELITEGVVSAMKALALLGDPESLQAIEKTATTGHNEMIRWQARNILDKLAKDKEDEIRLAAD